MKPHRPDDKTSRRTKPTQEKMMLTVTKAQLHQFLENGEDCEKCEDFREQVADVNG